MTASNRNRFGKTALAVGLATAVAASAAIVAAQETPATPPAETPAAPAAEPQTLERDPARVYAKIDGVPITEADLDVAAQEYSQELGQLPMEARLPQLLNVVIDLRLLAKAAEGAGIDKKDEVIRQVAFDRSRALRNEYLRDKAEKDVTDETIRARFDKEVAEFVPGNEFHLHHILVKTEDEAKAIIVDLDKGGDFAAIAKEKSLDPGSGAKGGDLGFVPKGLTFPEFEKAAFALEIGAMTKQPVETEVGWHVIKLEETRKEELPLFNVEQIRIRNEMIRELVTGEVESLRAAATIEIVPPPTAPAAERAPAGGGTPAPAEGGAETPAQ
jgi:peptidyl-prolyl cis-trans isomerase C